ncbi:MAG: NlpC/P60 family protein [Pseudomonadota bacterium]
MSIDRRITPARPDLAAASLRGKVEAERFVEGREMVVAVPLAPLTLEPDPEGPLDSQLLMGERFTLYEGDAETGFAWGQCLTDGYVGYVPQAMLEPAGAAIGTPHRVAALFTHLYPEPSVKCRPVEAFPFLAELNVTGREGDFVEVGGGYCPAAHVVAEWPEITDPVTWAERLLGVPYLWGGRSAAGLDCSALVQLALLAAGADCPRDSDMQQAEIGRPLRRNAALRRGDLVFWDGHVGWMTDKTTLLHANASHMAVVREPLAEAEARIAAAGVGPIRDRRRRADPG